MFCIRVYYFFFCFQHSSIEEAGTVPRARRFEDIVDVMDFALSLNLSTFIVQLEVVAHTHFLAADVTVDFF